MLEDSPPAALNPVLVPAPEPPEAAELPPPEDTAEDAPTVVMLMPPVPLLAPDPPKLLEQELLDVIKTELLVPPEPPDAALPLDPLAPGERSPRGKK